jgi:hypothetical protein
MQDSRSEPRGVTVPIGIGELIDKISILEIKIERIADEEKLRNVRAEFQILNNLKSAAGLDTPGMRPYADELKSINAKLWDIEDEIRELESRKDFGDRFIALARAVYLTNDRRASVKREINVTYGSDIIEEKSYRGS